MSLHDLYWKPLEGNRLALDVDGVTVEVPDEVTRLLVDPGGGLSPHADEDLLGVEGQLRRLLVERERHLAEVDEQLTATRARIDELDMQARAGRRRRPRAARREGSALARLLAEQIDRHTELVEAVRAARDGIEAVRRFVIDTEPQHGPLAQASCGWQRDPDVPAFVTVFASEQDFILVDDRRAIRGDWGGPVLDAEVFGLRWRRDGDDTDPDAEPASRAGPWQVGYLPRLGEVYALRRCHYLPEQVWLLASGLDDQADTRQVLTQLTERMAEPNSLILVARTLHYLANGFRHDSEQTWGPRGI